jgi:hypothetical protein
MYYKENADQLGIDEFFLPFGGKLKKDNRWVKAAEIMPWDYIEEVYLRSMSQETGRGAFPARIAYGAIYVRQQEQLTDEETVIAIAENPYIQYFLGLKEFRDEPLFDASMMVHFRKRFPAEELAKINEYICTGKRSEEAPTDNDDDGDDEPPTGNGDSERSSQAGKPNKNTSRKKQKRQKKNRGKLLMDATVAPADIKYPTDIDLLNKSREHLETAVNILWNELPHTGHKLPYSAKKARKSYLALAKCKKWTKAKCRKAISEQLRYIELASAQLKKYEAQVPEHEKLYSYWLKDRLLVIPKVYAQQKEMYENDTHKCEDRIVSLQQLHVRPINRGKRPNPTEFGQKLHLSVVDGFTYLEKSSWSSFNEGKELIAAAENYKRKFGYYPEAILADRIYQTRENRAFCTLHDIRLSGPPLGRRKAEMTEEKVQGQLYRDACERNGIEGRNGNAKRRWGLNLIMSKLDETAKTEAALSIIAMNVAHRLALWLSHFFGFDRVLLVFQ